MSAYCIEYWHRHLFTHPVVVVMGTFTVGLLLWDEDDDTVKFAIL
jgi:hypothetical protein